MLLRSSARFPAASARRSTVRHSLSGSSEPSAEPLHETQPSAPPPPPPAPLTSSSSSFASVTEARAQTTAPARKDRPQPLMGVDPTAPLQPGPLDSAKAALESLPLAAKVPAGFLLVFLATRTLGQVARATRKGGSLGSVRDRGMVYEDDQEFTEKNFKKVMRGVNTVSVEPLPDDVIRAARERRRQELAFEPVSLEDMDLPEDHPFAVKKKLTAEEEALIEARVRLRKGAPIQDLSDPRIKQLGVQVPEEGGGNGSNGKQPKTSRG